MGRNALVDITCQQIPYWYPTSVIQFTVDNYLDPGRF